MALDLSLTPIDTSALTAASLEALIPLSLSLINTLPSRPHIFPTTAPAASLTWSVAKSDAETHLYKTTHLSLSWFARITRVHDIPYDSLRHALLADKSGTEIAALLQPHDRVDSVGSVKEFGAIKVQDVHKLLHVQAFSAREFLEAIVYRDLDADPDSGRRAFTVVSLPRDGTVRDPANVRGVYVSIETVQELEDGGVEVIMASDAAGSIPKWVQNMAMAGQILGDGQKFFKYMREQEAEGVGE